MKQIILLVACVLIVSPTHAQRGPFERIRRMRENRPVHPLIPVGVTACSLGGVGVLFGGLLYSVEETHGTLQNDALIQIMAGGGVLIGAGITMIIVGVHRGNRPGRFTVISPRRNEAGLRLTFDCCRS